MNTITDHTTVTTGEDEEIDRLLEDQSILHLQKFGDLVPGTQGTEHGERGWVCPKCGSVLAPTQAFCPFCCFRGQEFTCDAADG